MFRKFNYAVNDLSVLFWYNTCNKLGMGDGGWQQFWWIMRMSGEHMV